MTYAGDAQYQPGRSGLARLLHAFQASFRFGRFFGVDVSVYWITAILMPVIFVQAFPDAMSWPETLTHAAIWLLLLYLVIWSHEMGHVAMGWRYRMITPRITLSPLGGIAHMATPAPRPTAEVWVALAGPATHLLWLLVVAPLWYFGLEGQWDLARPDGWMASPVTFAGRFLLDIHFWLMCFNLLPFFPMDGGRVLRALLSMRMHPNAATLVAAQVGIVGAVLFMVSAALFPFPGGSFILFFIGLNNIYACMQERSAARHSEGPYDATAGIRAWQSDPDAWKGGEGGHPGSASGFFQRRRDRRERRRQTREREEARNLDGCVDRILAKVSKVGMAGLTEEEKRTLMKASEARRKR